MSTVIKIVGVLLMNVNETAISQKNETVNSTDHYIP